MRTKLSVFQFYKNEVARFPPSSVSKDTLGQMDPNGIQPMQFKRLNLLASIVPDRNKCVNDFKSSAQFRKFECSKCSTASHFRILLTLKHLRSLR